MAKFKITWQEERVAVVEALTQGGGAADVRQNQNTASGQRL